MQKSENKFDSLPTVTDESSQTNASKPVFGAQCGQSNPLHAFLLVYSLDETQILSQT